MILLRVLTVLIILLVIYILILLIKNSRTQETAYYITVKFAHGIRNKLVLNSTQYEQFQAWLNGSDGFFEIGDENQHMKLYREFVCAVEVKKK